MFMARPALQRMQQPPIQVVALGMPMPQLVREPAMGYPNNFFYPGRRLASACCCHKKDRANSLCMLLH